MYDPTTARFLSKDPLEEKSGGTNFYLYCFNDPINYTDPSGNEPRESHLREGSRPSNLLIRADQSAQITKRLSDAFGGILFQTVPGPPGSEYVYVVLPPEALTEAGHAKIVQALAPYKLSNKDIHDDLAEALRAIYRGNITNPPGYSDRYLVIDPETGMGYLSPVKDFEVAKVSADISRIAPARLRQMVKDNFAQEIDGYMYVAWIDAATKQSYQLVYEPYRIVVENPDLEARCEERSALDLRPQDVQYYKLVRYANLAHKGGQAELAEVFKGITSTKAAQGMVDAVKTAKKGDQLDIALGALELTKKGLLVTLYMVPIVGTGLEIWEGNTTEAIISGIGDLSLLVGVGAFLKVQKGAKLVRGWRIAVGVTTAAEVGVAGYNVYKGVEDIRNEKYWEATAHFGEAGLRLIGITPGLKALWRSRAKAQAERTATEKVAAERAGRKLPAGWKIVEETDSSITIVAERNDQLKMRARVTSEGELRFDINVEPKGQGIGEELFDVVVEKFKGRVTAVRGTWTQVRPDNLKTFNERFAHYKMAGLNDYEAEIAAAKDTFTGKMAARKYNFTDVEILPGTTPPGPNGVFTDVEVLFTKPK